MCNCDDRDNLKPSRSASEGPLYCPIQVAIDNFLVVKSKNEKENSKCFDFNEDDRSRGVSSLDKPATLPGRP